ncbi:MAG TPA: hypothetical protein VEW05_28770 [Candidatus Polarisedimenticolia bacterium]|nr:hypothetical protein [Candidatus Polarisedimenticolia bacterium]
MRERRQEGESFRGDLPVAVAIVDPHGALAHAYSGNQGLPIGVDGDAFFFSDAIGQLLGLAVGKLLTP